MRNQAEAIIRLALSAAKLAAEIDVPIGAVLLDGSGEVLLRASNSSNLDIDSTAHAEMKVIRALGLRKDRAALEQLVLGVTLEPCPMCAWAIRDAGIRKVVFGAYNPAYGAAGSTFDLLRDTRFGNPVEVYGGVLREECKALIHQTFTAIRNNSER